MTLPVREHTPSAGAPPADTAPTADPSARTASARTAFPDTASARAESATATATARPARRTLRRTSTRTAGLLIALAVLTALAAISLGVGAQTIPIATALRALTHPDGSDPALVIWTLRIPRTLLAIAVGAALGLAGALMQALTRNPLADPGILGVNAGAAAAVVIGIAVFGFTTPTGYVWFALAGAAAASVLVYLLGSRGRASATPVRLALAGAAITAALVAVVSGIVLVNRSAFDSYRFWAVGGLAGRPLAVLAETAPFLAVGAIITLGLARPLNALALGDDAGRALGAHIGRTRGLGVAAVTLLVGGAVAAAGPIGFVGLTVPHIARAITGPDQRWVMPYSLLLAPILLLAADIAGRVLARPGELEAGIVTAFIGAPVFIAIARRARLAQL